eukprot:scaffold54697_cov70-Phaeocystis_antarctica.AAC.7
MENIECRKVLQSCKAVSLCIVDRVHRVGRETDGVALVAESNPLKVQASHLAGVVAGHGACLHRKGAVVVDPGGIRVVSIDVAADDARVRRECPCVVDGAASICPPSRDLQPIQAHVSAREHMKDLRHLISVQRRTAAGGDKCDRALA